VEQAAGAVAVTGKKIGYRKAMELVGFHVDEICNSALYKRVTRRAKAMMVAATELSPVPVVRLTNASSVSSLTNASVDPVAIAAQPIDVLVQTPPKKHRRSVKELNRFHSKKNLEKEKQKLALKAATTRIKHSQSLPKGDRNRQSVRVIVEQVNEAYNSNLSAKTAAHYVRKGMVGWSPLKPGPVGDFPKVVYEALKGAFSTYLKLEQAGCKRQSTIKQLVKIVNSTVNTGGFSKTDDNLTRKLRKDTADQFEIGKANVIEQR
jgi:hypothetical protein